MHKTGNVVVEGVAIGKIQFLNADYEEQIKRYMTGTEEEEKKRYQEAHTLAKDDLDSLLEDRDSLSESEAEIIEAHQLMIDDITFEDAILGYIEQKMSAPSAVLKAVDDFKAMFEDWARKNGASKYVIGVLKDNKKARAVYEKWGGKLSTYEEDFYKMGVAYKEVFYIYDL